MAKILIVDDDENMGVAFRQFLKSDGHHPIIASNAAEGLDIVQKEHPEVIFMDIRMPGIDGLEGLKRIRQFDPNAYVVIMTAYSSSQTSIEAMRFGAFDYLNKPFDLDDVRHIIEKAITAQTLSRKAAIALETSSWEQDSLVNLVGNSVRMREIYKLIGLLTTNNVPALLVGERGTGKQLSARTIHFNSNRKDHPFITINCEILPAEGVELEIFGRPPLASHPAYAGRLSRADAGTLFIDGVQHLPPTAQNKLLRYIKEKSFEPMGEGDPVTVDVRIIAATTVSDVRHANPAFSEELLDALRLITIELPPLRDRIEDIPELVTHFIRRHNKELNKNVKGIDDRSIAMLRNYGWPGNVAELENVTKRACILSRGDALTADDIDEAFQGGASPASEKVQSALEGAAREVLHLKLTDARGPTPSSAFHDIVSQIETVLVREALRITGGNQVQAAEILGLNRATLRKKMHPESNED